MQLSEEELGFLAGKEGKAVKVAMEILLRLAKLYNANKFTPITNAHIDGCLYTAVGDAGLEFAEKLNQWGATVRVPTTLNATSRDIMNWKSQRVDEEFSKKCRRLETAYLNMGAIPTWTCAPYQTEGVPKFGEQVAWAESNAIVYANSVIGARTERYGDYTDICCAITGRAPYFGLHQEQNRMAEIIIDCTMVNLDSTEDFSLLGYLTGTLSKKRIPYLTGIPRGVTSDQMKAFCAAVASSGAVAMFHMEDITPEAPKVSTLIKKNGDHQVIRLTDESIRGVGKEVLSSHAVPCVDLFVTGCPHASAVEVKKIEEMVHHKSIQAGVHFWVYTNRETYAKMQGTGVLDRLKDKGIMIILDTCFLNTDLSAWKFKGVMTNSAKYAHYMKSTTGYDVLFVSLEHAIDKLFI